MSVDGWMDTENVVHIYNGILFSLKKERNLAISDNMDELGGHYAKWNKPVTERHTTWSHWYVESKIVKFIEAESRMVCCHGLGYGGRREVLLKGYKVSVTQDE